ncbi:hypothetical protein J1N35_025220, partial [Gossypium stocksii]
GTLPIELDPEPKRILRQARHQMQNNLPIVADLPLGNPLFEEYIKPPALVSKRTLRD